MGKSKEDVKENFLKNGYLSATEDRNRVSRELVDAFQAKTNERIEEILSAIMARIIHTFRWDRRVCV